MATTTVSLTVPAERTNCADWLAGQAPVAVADVLEAAETLCTCVLSSERGPSDALREELRRVRGAHAEEVDGLASTIHEQCAVDLVRRTDDLRERHASETALLEAQVRERQGDVERTKRVLEEMHTRSCAELAQHRDQLLDDVDRLKGTLATHETESARRMDERTEALRAEFERDRAMRELLYQKNEGNLQLLLEEMRQGVEARVAVDRVQYEQRIRTLEEAVERRDTELREVQSTTVARVETLFNSLVGNSARKGDVGEALVRTIFAELELGTLAHVGRVQCTGFADFLWDFAPPTAATPLRAIVEIKFSQQGNRARDVVKFHEDVREAVHTGRANAALYISLVDRVEGRPKISVVLLHGVPVVWAARNADDDLSARSLVEMAFTTLAHIWPQLCSATGSDAVLHEVVSHVAQSIADFERMDHNLRAIEKANETIRTNTAQVRTARDRLLSAAHRFRTKHDARPTVDETALRCEVTEKMRAYYGRRKRYPSSLEELEVDVGEHEEMGRTVFVQVTESMKSEMYKQGQRKRRSE
jgi:hypothetical protein